MVVINWWSCDVKITLPGKLISALLTAVMDSKSRWLVGWSSMRKFAPESIMRESMTRTFSPPESTLTGLYTSSPEKSIRPRKPRMYVSSCSGEYWANHCIMLRLHPSKYLLLSLGK